MGALGEAWRRATREPPGVAGVVGAVGGSGVEGDGSTGRGRSDVRVGDGRARGAGGTDTEVDTPGGWRVDLPGFPLAEQGDGVKASTATAAAMASGARRLGADSKDGCQRRLASSDHRAAD